MSFFMLKQHQRPTPNLMLKQHQISDPRATKISLSLFFFFFFFCSLTMDDNKLGNAPLGKFLVFYKKQSIIFVEDFFFNLIL